FFDTPVTGGNVSFYNESPDTAVYPTPTIGMVGLVEKLENITTSYFKDDDDLIYLLGEDKEELGGSEYLKVIHNKVTGESPQLDLPTEKLLHNSLLSLIQDNFVKSAHDVSEGGIACCLAECCIINHEKLIGAKVTVQVKSREDFTLFSESQSRIIVSIGKDNKREFESLLLEYKQPYTYLGKTGGGGLNINDRIDLELRILAELYFNTIPIIMNNEE
ncbi:MAG: AIR synthase-related protein, partial [Ignavibacteria bacterium]|nr:AIR synthase-related protein [Ignavibacteria bacterium]